MANIMRTACGLIAALSSPPLLAATLLYDVDFEAPVYSIYSSSTIVATGPIPRKALSAPFSAISEALYDTQAQVVLFSEQSARSGAPFGGVGTPMTLNVSDLPSFTDYCLEADVTGFGFIDIDTPQSAAGSRAALATSYSRSGITVARVEFVQGSSGFRYTVWHNGNVVLADAPLTVAVGPAGAEVAMPLTTIGAFNLVGFRPDYATKEGLTAHAIRLYGGRCAGPAPTTPRHQLGLPYAADYFELLRSLQAGQVVSTRTDLAGNAVDNMPILPQVVVTSTRVNDEKGAPVQFTPPLQTDSSEILSKLDISGQGTSENKLFRWQSRELKNVALKKMAWASSTLANQAAPGSVLDATIDATSWGSQRSGAQWLAVDLADTVGLTGVNVYWDNLARGKNGDGIVAFCVETSLDGKIWLQNMCGNSVGPTHAQNTQNIALVPTTARYVRLKSAADAQGMSLWSLEAIGEHIDHLLPVRISAGADPWSRRYRILEPDVPYYLLAETSFGRSWRADTNFNTGNTTVISRPIATPKLYAYETPPEIYQSERWDLASGPELSYKVSVPNGKYHVRLHFAETWPGAFAVGKRVFDVLVQNKVVEKDLDVFARMGADTAFVRDVYTTVTNGIVDVTLKHIPGKDNPHIQGIEIYEAFDQGNKGAIRVNAGGGSTVTNGVNKFYPDSGFNTGKVTEWLKTPIKTYNPSLLYLYQTERWAPTNGPNLEYRFTNLANGQYSVKLYFAELWPGAFGVGKRVFDVKLEDQTLSNIDVYAAVGARTGYEKSVIVNLQDSEMNIKFDRKAGDPHVSAIEIVPLF